MVASAGTTLSVVPAAATVGVTVVPASGRLNEAIARTWCAASTSAFTPASGSRPACEARPRTATSNVPQPLRATFRCPPSAAPSNTSTVPHARARSSISAREWCEPTSSSVVTNSSTPDGSAKVARPWIAWTRPPSMSYTPGPVARPPSTRNGRCSKVPRGKTVSWWPSTRTRGSPPPSQRTCVPAGPSTRVARPPRRRSTRAATASADLRRATRSREGDSTSTSVRRSWSITSTSTSVPSRSIMRSGYGSGAGSTSVY